MHILREAVPFLTKAWSPFSMLGGVCLLYVLAPWHFAYRRQAKGFVYFSHRLATAFAALLIATGLAALVVGQPQVIWRNYALAGLLGSMFFWGSGRALNRIYSGAQ